jgi:O-antigen ligase
VAISLPDKDKQRTILWMVVAALCISVLAIYQYFFGFQHVLNYLAREKISDPFILDYLTRRRVFFPFVTPNTLAGYLAMLIPLALIYKKRVWLLIPLAFALLLSKSIGALFSLFLAALVYFSLRGKPKKKEVLLLSAILAIALAVLVIRSGTQKFHLTPLFSTLMRLSYWRGALSIIKAHPFVGVGLGNFNLAPSRYAHNSYLQIWAEMGTLGIFALLWLVYNTLRIGLTRLKEKSQDRVLAGLFLANLVFLFHNLLDFSFFLPEVSLLWWVILGLMLKASS